MTTRGDFRHAEPLDAYEVSCRVRVRGCTRPSRQSPDLADNLRGGFTPRSGLNRTDVVPPLLPSGCRARNPRRGGRTRRTTSGSNPQGRGSRRQPYTRRPEKSRRGHGHVEENVPNAVARQERAMPRSPAAQTAYPLYQHPGALAPTSHQHPGRPLHPHRTNIRAFYTHESTDQSSRLDQGPSGRLRQRRRRHAPRRRPGGRRRSPHWRPLEPR